MTTPPPLPGGGGDPPSAASTISGHAFFDSQNDGTRDPSNPTDYGVYDVSVYLFDCLDNLVKTESTDVSGRYEFENLEPGEYYVDVPAVPSWYIFTEVWGGVNGVGGAYPNAQSAVDPDTGRTDCFVLEGGDEKDVSFGLRFDMTLATPPPTSSPSRKTFTAITSPPFPPTGSPTDSGLTAITSPPFPPTGSPADSPGLFATSPPFPPTASPTTLRPTESPTTFPPTASPITLRPTDSPTTLRPTGSPITLRPTVSPITQRPTDSPTTLPPSARPSVRLSVSPSGGPSSEPTAATSAGPSNAPSGATSEPPSSTPSTLRPTGYPTARPTPGPTAQPSPIPSGSPSSSPTTSARPSAAPTEGPTLEGEFVGPVSTQGLVMTIRGIGTLEDEDEWAEETRRYIMDFFNDVGGELGVWEVAVDITVKSQVSGGGDDGEGSSRRRRRRLRHRRHRDEMPRGRRLQASSSSASSQPYVEVTYNQRSMYKSADPEYYNGMYVATRPFDGRNTEYIDALGAMSPFYLDVTSVRSVTLDQADRQPTPPDAVRQPDGGGGDGGSGSSLNVWAIVGGVCGGLAFVLIVVAFVVVYRRRKQGQRRPSYGGGDPNIDHDLRGRGSGTSSSEFETVDLRGGNGNSSVASSSRRNSPESLNGASSSSSSPTGMVRKGGHDDGHPAPSPPVEPGPGEVAVDVVAPSGRLGVVVDTPPEGGPPYVCEIKPTSPIVDQIRLEDRIVAVDEKDVAGWSAVDVSKLLASRSRNPERRIRVLRDARLRDAADVARIVDDDDDMGESGEGEGSTTFLGDVTSEEEEDVVERAAASTPLPMAEIPLDDENVEEIDIIAPSGKLGVVLVTPEPPEVGPPYVFNIRADSILEGKARLGDRIIRVDGEGVQGMTAIAVSKLLGSKSENPERRITVLREIVEEKEEEPDTDNKDRSRASQDDSGASSSSSSSTSSTMTEDVASEPASDRAAAVTGDSAVAASASDPPVPINPNEERIEIFAPAGKLGVVVDSPPEGGSAYVSDIKEESPIRGEIRLGDRLISVDDEDVSKLKAIHVSMLLGSKSRNTKRKLTVLREIDDDDE